MEINIAGKLDLLGVNLENGFASFEVWQLNGHAPVEAAGTQQCRVKRLRAVRRREDDDAVVALEAVHFGEELVQCLLALVVAHEVAAALLADGVDFVDEDDARRFFFGLLEEVTDFRCAHADEHLNELGACNREERHVGLARDGFREHRLAGARRSDEQHAFRHLRTDGRIFLRVVQVVDDFRKIFFCLVFACDVLEMNAFGRRHVDPRLLAAHAEHHRAAAAARFLHELAAEILADGKEDDDRQHPGHEEIKERRILLLDVLRELRTRIVQALGERRVAHDARAVLLRVIRIREENLVLLDFDATDFLLIDHVHERAVIDLLELRLLEIRPCHFIEHQDEEQHHDIEEQQRLLRFLDFLHRVAFFVPEFFQISCNFIKH